MPQSEVGKNKIPVIDISQPSEQVAQQVLDAASTRGFLYIKNDGVTIPPQDIDDMFELVGSRPRTMLYQKLMILEQRLLRSTKRTKSWVCHSFGEGGRHKPRLGPNAR
jgi:hypothetical protein